MAKNPRIDLSALVSSRGTLDEGCDMSVRNGYLGMETNGKLTRITNRHGHHAFRSVLAGLRCEMRV